MKKHKQNKDYADFETWKETIKRNRDRLQQLENNSIEMLRSNCLLSGRRIINTNSTGKDSMVVTHLAQLVEKPCHYCGGYSSDWNTKSRGNGIDRKDSNIGYVYENCVPCCSKCNFIKNKIPYKDFLRYIRRLYETTKDYPI